MIVDLPNSKTKARFIHRHLSKLPNCTGVPKAKVITIALSGVTVGAVAGDLSAPMGMLLGDVTVNKIVSNTDIAEVKAQVSAPVDVVELPRRCER